MDFSVYRSHGYCDQWRCNSRFCWWVHLSSFMIWSLLTGSSIVGPYFVNNDNMGFGWPTRYLVLEESKVEGGRSAWDDAVAKASADYMKRMHNLIWDNCHSHVGMALSLMRYKNSTSFNMVRLAAWLFFSGKYVGCMGFVKTWLPFCTFFITVYLLYVFT